MSEGPLTGVRAVELAQPHGEWLGKLLAGLGAEVVKVEPPGGALSRTIGPFADDRPGRESSLFFLQFNAGKRSVELDMSSAAGRDALSRLLAGCDVFVETMLHPETGKLGLDYETLGALNPSLIQVSVTPFGQSGPYVDAGYETTDLILMALGGPMQSCGYDPDERLPPVRPGLYHSYYAACHYGCIATLAALWERETSGLGQYVDVSMQAALAVTNEFANLHWEYAGAPVIRQTGRHAFPRITPPMQLYCSDGRMINIMLPRDERSWRRLVEFLRSEGLGGAFDDGLLRDPARRPERSSLAMNDLEVVAALRTAEEMFHLGQRMGMTWGAIRAPEDWLADPHAAARGFFVAVEHDDLGRSVTCPGAPVLFGATPWQTARAPRLGEHTEEVLQQVSVVE